MQHALCVLLLGCDPSLPATQCSLFSCVECPCLLPHFVGQAKAGAKDAEATDVVKSMDKHLAAALCFKCGRAASLHALPARDPLGAAADGFLVELCRVGSVGWQSHAFTHAVYDRSVWPQAPGRAVH